jgi:ribonuclease HI
VSAVAPATVTVYTDGGASPNPGPGGWGVVILRDDGEPEELSGGETRTTNNRMELTAALRALEAVPADVPLRLVTDSQYLRNGVTRWLTGWIARGWRRAGGHPVENEDLWRRLAARTAGRAVRWEWTRGHAGDRWNQRADRLAAAEIQRHYDERAPAAEPAGAPDEAEVFLRVSSDGRRSGWAALVREAGGAERRASGALAGATANRAEVLAAAAVLGSLPEGARVAVFTPSDYLRNGASRWLPAWRRRGWTTKEGRPVANRDAWERLAAALAAREVRWPELRGTPPEELAALEAPARDARAAG